MNVILHGEGKEIRMHQCSTDVFQHKITIPFKIFSGFENKWKQPVIEDSEQVYKFMYQDGSCYHYQLDHITSKQS